MAGPQEAERKADAPEAGAGGGQDSTMQLQQTNGASGAECSSESESERLGNREPSEVSWHGAQ